MMHGSFGTLGILSKLTFRLVAGEAVTCTCVYEKYATLEEYQAAIWRHFEARDVDFMDGIIHSPTEYVLVARPLRRRRAVHEPLRLDEGLLPEHARRAREDYLDNARLLLPLRPRRHQRAAEVVRRAPAVRQARSTRAACCASPRSCTGSCDDERPTITLDVFVPFSQGRTSSSTGTSARSASSRCGACRTGASATTSGSHDASTTASSDELFLDLAIYGMKQRRRRKNYHR